MKPYTYLLIDCLTVIICFIFSFDKRIAFYRKFPSFIIAAAIVAIPFIAWDVWFTKQGVWWFAMDYTMGITIFSLPVEEWLFFLCIPFSCVFTYYCLDKFFNLSWADALNNIVVFVSVIVCVLMAMLHHDQLYTFVTAVATAVTLMYLHFIARAPWIGRTSFVFFVLMLGFIPVNGVLTGMGLTHPIVNYNADEILNIRIITIPIEDAVYGYTQFLLLIYFYKYFDARRLPITASCSFSGADRRP
jgi:lycopene cyclase domain-containing protein